jgi:Zn-dependent membrane protease YugP
LERILAAVEKQKRPHWIQVLRAIVLSLAALASAWSAYQASRWNDVAGSQSGRAANAARLAAVRGVQALQFRAFDATMVIHFLEAKEDGNERLAEFLRSRFRPDVKPAVEAWLKTEPFTNPSAPASPLVMAEYVSKELTEAQRYDEEAQQNAVASAAAGRTSNSFVLLTLLFATVLFLGSLANSLPSTALQNLVSIGALLVFATTLIRLLTLPVAPWK